MKYIPLAVIAILALAGCSSATSPLRQNIQVTEFTAGESDSDKTSFYWLTERFETLEKSTDDVKFSDDSWYQSHYIWDGDNLCEIVRVGERRTKSNNIVPFQVTLRFSQRGEAVYQHMRVDNRVIPMRIEQIDEIRTQADELVATSKSQHDKGLELIQGYWEGGTFTTCSGQEYKNIEFKQQMPRLLVERLKEEDSFVAFMGELSGSGKVFIDQMLLLKRSGFDCIERPELES